MLILEDSIGKPSLTFNDLFSSIDKKLHNMDSAKISIPELCDWYHTCLKGMKIVDNHLTIYTLYNGIFRFGAEYAAYFTDVTVEKILTHTVLYRVMTNK